MDDYVIVTKSITQAQQMQRSLSRRGVWSRIERGHRAIMPEGCGYVLRIAGRELEAALWILRHDRLEPGKLYQLCGGVYREVVL